MLISRLIVTFVFLFNIVHSLVIIDSSLASACVYYMKTFEWGCGGFGQGKKLYACRCGNIDWLGSVTNCIKTQSNNTNEVNHAITHVIKRCHAKGNFNYTFDEMIRYYENATAYLQYPTAVDKIELVETPLSVNITDFAFYDKSFKSINHHVYKSQWLGWGLNFFWVAVITIATLININNHYFKLKLFHSLTLKKYLTLPALFGKYNEQTYYFLNFIPINFPTRLQTFILLIFIVQVILSTALSYTVELPNAYINDSYFLTLDLIGYRSAILAFSLFPAIYFFGIRNNPFSLISGFSYADFIVFHKAIAIIMALEALIHSSVWTAYSIRDGGYKMWAMDSYWSWGVVGTTIVFILLFQSIKIIRTLMYETFLMFHKVLNILFIVSMWYHCNILGWMGWVYSMIGIWCFDRVARIIKIVMLGGLQTVELEKFDNNVCKISVRKPKFFKYYPGSYVFVYFMNPWYGMWQSHPFTIISSPIESEDNLVIYFKPKKGITGNVSKLLDKLSSDGKKVTIKIIMEGPYGNTIPVSDKDKDNTIIGIGGGVGICSVLPHIYGNMDHQSNIEYSLLTVSDSDREFSKKDSIRSPIAIDKYQAKLYWIINDINHLIWLHNELNYLVKNNVQVKVVVTQENQDLEKLISQDDRLYDVRNLGSRADLPYLIQKNIEKGIKNNTNLTFVTCGPSSFNDDMRKFVVDNLKVDSPNCIDHRIESYVW